MRRTLTIALVALLAITAASCARDVNIDGKIYPAYGFVNENASRSADACYQMSLGSIIVSVILFETLIVPIVAFGFDLYEATRAKRAPNDDCSFDFKAAST